MRWALVLALAVGQAWACVCGVFPSAKQAWQDSPVVLVGLVTQTQPDLAPLQNHTGPQKVWVRVEEPFKGIRTQEMFVLDQRGGDCAPKFAPGARVLLYLRHAGFHSWESPGCYRVVPANEAADDLLFLRALPGSAEGNRLSGTVRIYERGPRLSNPKGFPGVRVTISGDGHSTETITNSDGVYEVFGLPSGEYKVDIEVPPDQLCFPMIEGQAQRKIYQQEIKLGPNSGISVDFMLRPHDPELRKWFRRKPGQCGM